MYEFVRGPLVWIAFIGFIIGLIYRLITTVRLAKKEKVVLPTLDTRYGLRSLMHWIVPFMNRNTRHRPFYTLISYGFHACLLITPLFLMGHAVLWKESWGIRWWSLPEGVADGMTLFVIAGCLFFMARRLICAEVRNVSFLSDFLLALLVLAPFATGYAAHHQWWSYRPTLMVHIMFGTLCPLLIPWTRLVHMIWFAFTRAYMGSEFGAVRQARDW